MRNQFVGTGLDAPINQVLTGSFDGFWSGLNDAWFTSGDAWFPEPSNAASWSTDHDDGIAGGPNWTASPGFEWAPDNTDTFDFTIVRDPARFGNALRQDDKGSETDAPAAGANAFEHDEGGYRTPATVTSDDTGPTDSGPAVAPDGLVGPVPLGGGASGNRKSGGDDGFGNGFGHRGDTSYDWHPGDGDLFIFERGKDSNDTLSLHIDAGDAEFSRSGNNLVIRIGDETITIKNQFTGNSNTGHGIELVTFDDGTVLDEAAITQAAIDGGVNVITDETDTGIPEVSVIVGTPDADDLAGTAVGDSIFGLAGDDMIHGGAGDDVIEGGAGLDTLFGDEGADTFVFNDQSGYDYIIDFTAGEDKIMVGTSVVADGRSPLDYAYQDGPSTIFEFPDGNVLVLWHVDLATLTEDMFEIYDDTAIAGTAIVGSDGDDELEGGSGDDVIFGGAGYDVIQGGHGADDFLFSKGSERDFIIDFNGEHDRIVIDADLVADGMSVMDYVYQDGENVVIDFGDGDSMVLWHVDMSMVDDTNILVI